MGFEQYGGYGRIGYEVTDHWNLRADVNVTHFNASYPGPVSAPLLDGDQRITRGMTSFAVENEYEKTSGALSFFYNWGDHWINDGYTPSAGEGPQDDRFNSYDDMMGISWYQSARFFKDNRITVGFDWFRYGGEAWSEYVSGEDAGTRSDLVDKHETRWQAMWTSGRMSGSGSRSTQDCALIIIPVSEQNGCRRPDWHSTCLIPSN